MRHKTWFRLVMKAIGILLIGMSLPTIVQSVTWIVNMYDQRSSVGITTFRFIVNYVGSLAGYLLQFAFGLYLIVGGKWLVDRIIPSNHPYCPECGYDLSSRPGDVCPECGHALPEEVSRDAVAGSTTGEEV